MIGADASPFARQTLICGWDQERLTRARVMVAGVGALGNASAVDLALTGIGRLLLVDFDHIETSNLSRTMLFRRGDEGRRKVVVAAERLRPLALAPDARVVPLDADVAWDVGWGVYRRLDLVLGCVDSSEARAAVGAAARAFGVPAVFGGLHGHDGSVVIPSLGEGPCVACGFSAGEWAEWSRRYSCNAVRHALAAEARIPATQVTAALVSAFMAQEGLKLLHGDRRALGTRLMLAGAVPAIERVGFRIKPRCPFHPRIGPVAERADLSARDRAGDVIERLSSWLGQPASVSLGRDFLLRCRCQGCGAPLPLMKPRHRTRTTDLVCVECHAHARPLARPADIERLDVIGPGTARAWLDLSLATLGVPPLHVLEVEGGPAPCWIELTGDLPAVLPDWPDDARPVGQVIGSAAVSQA